MPFPSLTKEQLETAVAESPEAPYIAHPAAVEPSSGLYRAIETRNASLRAAMHERMTGLVDYLDLARQRGFITKDTQSAAWALYTTLYGEIENNLSVPNAVPTENGHVIYVWENARQYLELELYPDGHVEAYGYSAQKRVTDDEFEFVEGNSRSGVPAHVLAALREFAII